ncbi:hypothetical protein [Kibdelosporangium aridum]|uniref:Uncharacterized protein n=1 Tax=Kibdelosporangium aridum TaxID=2030 RepID=A0A1W2FSP7_KIBAR|nr:hypothetical protein [Kibdelosporangium aridum]SMD24987.1 hypothetical protein SAMN05661093_08852 [Kibdelosporangium aridum]
MTAMARRMQEGQWHRDRGSHKPGTTSPLPSYENGMAALPEGQHRHDRRSHKCGAEILPHNHQSRIVTVPEGQFIAMAAGRAA